MGETTNQYSFLEHFSDSGFCECRLRHSTLQRNSLLIDPCPNPDSALFVWTVRKSHEQHSFHLSLVLLLNYHFPIRLSWLRCFLSTLPCAPSKLVASFLPRITFTPDSTTPSTFIISRGESGYSNNERAEILLVRAQLRGEEGAGKMSCEMSCDTQNC